MYYAPKDQQFLKHHLSTFQVCKQSAVLQRYIVNDIHG